MKIELKSLRYDFRGQRQDLTFGDKTLISGRNGSGKSTSLNALLWLLTGYDVDDVANSNLFDNRTTDSPENPKSVKVTAIFDIEGKELKLTKEAKQVWKRPRGKVEYERGNDTYTYYVDDLETPARDYAELIESTFGKGEKLKLMLNSNYWEMLDEKVLRKHFLAIVGDIKAEDFEDISRYTPILDFVLREGTDKARQTFMNRIRDLKEAQTKQKASLDAQVSNLTDTSEVESAEARIKTLKEERESIDAKLLGLAGAYDDVVAKRKQEADAICDAEAKFVLAKNEYHNNLTQKVREAQRKLDDALANNRRLDSDEARLKRDIENCENNIKRYELMREEKLKEMEQIDLRKFDGNCPHCGASLVGQARAEAIARFKEKQSTDKQLCLTQGQKIRKDLDFEKERKSTLEADLANLKRIDTKPLREELAKIQEESQRPFESTESAKNLQSEIETLKANRTEMQPNPDVEKGQIRKGEIDNELAEAYKIVALKDVRAKEDAKVVELQMMLKQTADALAQNERMKMLVEEYQKEQSEIIRVRANRLFEKVEVVMEEMNKSGNLVPCCKMRIDGVIDTANTASRTRIGFEVSRAFQRYYDRVLPLFLDRAESLNWENIPDHDGQMVLLRVDNGDFRVEDYTKEMIKERQEKESEEASTKRAERELRNRLFDI